MDVNIRVKGLGKKYLIGGSPVQKYGTLRESLVKGVRGVLYGSSGMVGKEDFWALRDVTFDVQQGDRLGIIGRNGAGKTTLLKILSRITELTEGKIGIRGRIASLLEVGTGFHPELTGRENIFLNGAILGMGKKEIKLKFDEIVDFAETERFLDTPVKRYSTGMYVRLAFSVAAHLEPEILLVDEVLAVGDAKFQKKCLGKMNDVSREGRTIIFVSHQMEAVSKLCSRCLLLDQGGLVMDETTDVVIEKYLSGAISEGAVSLSDRKDRHGEGGIRFTDTWLEDQGGRRVTTVRTGNTVKIVAAYETKGDQSFSGLIVAFALNSSKNVSVTDLSNLSTGDELATVKGKGQFECVIPRLTLNVGRYSYNVSVSSGKGAVEDWIIEANYFDVEGGDFFGSGKIPDAGRLILMEHSWKNAGS